MSGFHLVKKESRLSNTFPKFKVGQGLWVKNNFVGLIIAVTSVGFDSQEGQNELFVHLYQDYLADKDIVPHLLVLDPEGTITGFDLRLLNPKDVEQFPVTICSE